MKRAENALCADLYGLEVLLICHVFGCFSNSFPSLQIFFFFLNFLFSSLSIFLTFFFLPSSSSSYIFFTVVSLRVKWWRKRGDCLPQHLWIEEERNVWIDPVNFCWVWIRNFCWIPRIEGSKKSFLLSVLNLNRISNLILLNSPIFLPSSLSLFLFLSFSSPLSFVFLEFFLLHSV